MKYLNFHKVTITPVFFSHASGHTLVLNSAVAAAANIKVFENYCNYHKSSQKIIQMTVSRAFSHDCNYQKNQQSYIKLLCR